MGFFKELYKDIDEKELDNRINVFLQKLTINKTIVQRCIASKGMDFEPTDLNKLKEKIKELKGKLFLTQSLLKVEFSIITDRQRNKKKFDELIKENKIILDKIKKYKENKIKLKKINYRRIKKISEKLDNWIYKHNNDNDKTEIKNIKELIEINNYYKDFLRDYKKIKYYKNEIYLIEKEIKIANNPVTGTKKIYDCECNDKITIIKKEELNEEIEKAVNKLEFLILFYLINSENNEELLSDFIWNDIGRIRFSEREFEFRKELRFLFVEAIDNVSSTVQNIKDDKKLNNMILEFINYDKKYFDNILCSGGNISYEILLNYLDEYKDSIADYYIKYNKKIIYVAEEYLINNKGLNEIYLYENFRVLDKYTDKNYLDFINDNPKKDDDINLINETVDKENYIEKKEYDLDFISYYGMSEEGSELNKYYSKREYNNILLYYNIHLKELLNKKIINQYKLIDNETSKKTFINKKDITEYKDGIYYIFYILIKKVFSIEDDKELIKQLNVISLTSIKISEFLALLKNLITQIETKIDYIAGFQETIKFTNNEMAKKYYDNIENIFVLFTLINNFPLVISDDV